MSASPINSVPTPIRDPLSFVAFVEIERYLRVLIINRSSRRTSSLRLRPLSQHVRRPSLGASSLE